jgi:hypothetical protein
LLESYDEPDEHREIEQYISALRAVAADPSNGGAAGAAP